MLSFRCLLLWEGGLLGQNRHGKGGPVFIAVVFTDGLLVGRIMIRLQLDENPPEPREDEGQFAPQVLESSNTMPMTCDKVC